MNPALLGIIASARRHSAGEAWDPANTFGTWTFSNSDRAADSATNAAVLSLNGKSSGKRYFEITWTVITANYASTVRHDAGLQSQAVAPSLGSVRGVNASAYNRAGAIFVDNVQVATYTALAQGDTILCAVDLGTGKIWYGRNGVWNGDPAAGTGEAGTMPAGTYKLAAGYESAGADHNTYLIRSASNELLYAVPAGFKLWNDT